MTARLDVAVIVASTTTAVVSTILGLDPLATGAGWFAAAWIARALIGTARTNRDAARATTRELRRLAIFEATRPAYPTRHYPRRSRARQVCRAHPRSL